MATAKYDISKQFEKCVENAMAYIPQVILPQLVEFGIHMVNNVIPGQAEFRNLTGNTLTSYAFGVYHEGKLYVMGFNKDAKPALRNKLVKGETVRDFTDYDGRHRTYFRADVDTNGELGRDTSAQFLQSYKPEFKYSIVFTTGTEYSAYLENVRDLNVLTEAFETSKTEFLQSFKPIGR